MPKTNSNQKNSITVQSPGRINIIGEHTDYNEGFVLPAAINKKTIFQLRRNASASTANITATNLDESFVFDLTNFAPLTKGWQNYVMGVVHELQLLGAGISGFDGEFKGNVPIGSGLSSSAALECSLAFGLNELFGLGFEKKQLMKAAQMAEHHFVGTKCGIMDQFASLMGKKDQVMLLDCHSLEHSYYPLELGDYQILLLNSNVSHSLASSEYNTRRAECEEGVALLQKIFPTITHLRDVSFEELIANKEKLPELIYRRCHHVVSENLRVSLATKALLTGNKTQLGRLIYRSHHSLQHDYEVSCPELDYLVEQTTDKDYILGSRMMGGGFGGCTISIIEKRQVQEFTEFMAKQYRLKFGIDLTPYSISIEDGTKELG